jgi:transcriptional regulator with XRE-family HTH domain
MTNAPIDEAATSELRDGEDYVDATTSALMAIGIRIREIRRAGNMTLQALANATKLSPSMLSLVERGRASPSIGSLVVIANALGVTMSDFLAGDPAPEEKLVVHASQQRAIETSQHVIRRMLREDKTRDVSIALNEYEPHTGNDEQAIAHNGFEYGYVLTGKLTVEVDGTAYVLEAGDLISYSSRRPHRIWNNSEVKIRTLWFNLSRD